MTQYLKIRSSAGTERGRTSDDRICIITASKLMNSLEFQIARSVAISAFIVLTALFFSLQSANAASVSVMDEQGNYLNSVMVTESPTSPPVKDISDDGYPAPGRPTTVGLDITQFTDTSGKTIFDDGRGLVTYRFRKPGYKDVSVQGGAASIQVTLIKETDPFKIADSQSANAWVASLDIPPEDKKFYRMDCAFCHQQGTTFTRQERAPSDWRAVIERMIAYGSRIPGSLQKTLPEKLTAGYKNLREHPALVAAGTPWPADLSHYRISEWPVGDSMSLTHDLVIGRNGLVYVSDTVQDRLYEVNTTTNQVTTYRIPHRDSDTPGGLINATLESFPKHDSTSQAHSLAVSKVDGHIFITPPSQRRLIEFDPTTKQFTLHEMEQGLHAHTIRIDQKDRVWFTLALSDQVAMFDRKSSSFTYYNLPARSLWERVQIAIMPFSLKLMSYGVPLSRWFAPDEISTGFPFPYGIDIAPNGKVWFARLYSEEIGEIDPDTGTITMIHTPFIGPRRLRADANGNIWIASFGSSLIAKYVPDTRKFETYDLPVMPKGSETPYVLNIDNKKGLVWVSGNQSDITYVFDIKRQSWNLIPMPKTTTFTREFDFDEAGATYTVNSNFPAWHIEGGQPTLIRIETR